MDNKSYAYSILELLGQVTHCQQTGNGFEYRLNNYSFILDINFNGFYQIEIINHDINKNSFEMVFDFETSKQIKDKAEDVYCSLQELIESEEELRIKDADRALDILRIDINKVISVML